VSDEYATKKLATGPQQVVSLRVGLVKFEERHNTRTNGQLYTAAADQSGKRVAS